MQPVPLSLSSLVLPPSFGAPSIRHSCDFIVYNAGPTVGLPRIKAQGEKGEHWLLREGVRTKNMLSKSPFCLVV